LRLIRRNSQKAIIKTQSFATGGGAVSKPVNKLVNKYSTKT